MQYALGKFKAGIDGMATSARSLQERLQGAAMSWPAVFASHFAAGEIREHYETIHRRLTCAKAVGDEGTIAATTSKMTDDEAAEIAHLIVEFRDELRREHVFSLLARRVRWRHV